MPMGLANRIFGWRRAWCDNFYPLLWQKNGLYVIHTAFFVYTMGMKTQRLLYLDLLRILSVTAVLMAHVAGSVWGDVPVLSHSWGILTLYTALIRFCIPVFLMISGAIFLNESKKIGIKVLYTHYLSRIIIIFLFWSTLYSCFSTFMDNGGGTMFAVRLFTGHYHLWYLFAIAFLYLIVPFLRKFAPDRRLCLYYIALWLIGLTLTSFEKVMQTGILSTILSKASINFVLGYTGYFVMGHYLHTVTLTSKQKTMVYSAAAVGFFVTFFGTYAASILNALPYDAFLSNFSPFVALFGAGVFLYCKESCTQLSAKKERRLKGLCRLSPFALGVYLIHDFFLIILRHFGVTPLAFYPLVSVPLITAVIWLLSFASVYLMQKVSFFKKVL